MSNSFEININADEWLDITSKEELLQSELNQLKNELETRSMELLESNVTIDLLKGHKTLLENERNNLLEELQQSKQKVSQVSKELMESTEREVLVKEEMATNNATALKHTEDLNSKLSTSERELKQVKSQIGLLTQKNVGLTRDHQMKSNEARSTIERLTKLVENLNSNVRSLQDSAKQQQAAFAESQTQLRKSQFEKGALLQEVAKQKKLRSQREAELKQSRSGIESVSVLAEQLKSKNVTLGRSMTNLQKQADEMKKSLAQSLQREAILKAELAEARAAAEKQTEEQEQTINANCEALDKSEDRIVGLEAYVHDLKEQCVILSEECEAVREELGKKEELCKELESQKAILEAEVKKNESETNVTDLEKARNASAREEELKQQLAAQKEAFEARLKEIRSILGVSPIAEIQTEFNSAYRRSKRCVNAKESRNPLLVGLQKFGSLQVTLQH